MTIHRKKRPIVKQWHFHGSLPNAFLIRGKRKRYTRTETIRALKGAADFEAFRNRLQRMRGTFSTRHNWIVFLKDMGFNEVSNNLYSHWEAPWVNNQIEITTS